MNAGEICIVIPVYNEAGNISRLVRSVRGKGFDVVVVNDGSDDGSGALAREAGAYVLDMASRHGKGFALQAGFQHVLTKSYSGVVLMDGDGQHAPEDLPEFLAAVNKGQGDRMVIVGNRLADPKGMPWLRYATNRIMSGLISWTCGQQIPDTQCGFRYISCDLLRQLIIETRAFEVETEILMKAAALNVPIRSIPIRTIYASEVSYIRPVRDTFNFIRYFIKHLLGRKKDNHSNDEL
jgi:glycosyltransferase involved in cell wall biosynthesis